jgi:mono/diheme cytochrome c family protein
MTSMARGALVLGWLVGSGCADECDEVLTTADKDPIKGQVVYDNRCSTCHGKEGFGGSGPDLHERLPLLTSCEIVDTVRMGPGVMPAWSKSDIDTPELANLIGFMTTEFQ